jgi:uncharacterized protein DUF6049
VKRLAAIGLAGLFLVGQGLLGAPAMAQQSPEPPRLRLEVSQMNPRYVTSTSTTLNIPGKITNIGDRKITKLVVRPELGDRLTTELQLTDTIAGGVATTSDPPRFQPVIDTLEPGQSAPFNITVPLGTGPNALQVTKAGVYPLLVNVNGTPEFGGAARLAALSMLLPVVGVPGKDTPHPPKAAGLSILWPIANTVPRVASMPFRGQLLLTDDDLATELAPGGRLHSLVMAAKLQQDNDALFNSMCFALDPDLVDTAELMTHGYQFRTGSGTTDGKGVQAAKDWLDLLKQVTAGHCVVSMPYADADLTVLSKVRNGDQPDTDLVTAAVSGASVIQRVLNVQPQRGVLWPEGSLDTKTLAMLSAAGIETVLAESKNLQSDGPVTTGVSLSGTELRAQPIDSLLAAALAGKTDVKPSTNGNVALATGVSTQPAVAAQNGLAALAFRAGLGQQAASPGQLLLAPPRRWNVPLGELQNLLRTVGDYTTAGLVAPKSLQQLLATSAESQATMTSGAKDTGGSDDLSESISAVDTTTSGLASAMTVDSTSQVKPVDLISPVRTGLVRAAAVAWQDNAGGVPAATFNARTELASLSDRVAVLPPPQTLSLASGTSPLPVLVSNSLPVAITVRVTLLNNAALRPSEQDQAQNRLIPANGSVPQYIPIEALRAGRFSVDVALTTPAGNQLGAPARFELTSNDFGIITVIVTASAGGALLLLSSRRIYRRIKESKAQRGA